MGGIPYGLDEYCWWKPTGIDTPRLSPPLTTLSIMLPQACKGERALSVPQRKGQAILFDSQFANLTFNPWTWHAGCNVVKGTKIIMQKFKELPMSERKGPHRHHQPDVPYQPFVA
eukprot:m.230319 g.230319  ORF g.230319 m.230319 type:complete len:115 (+) comp26455_c0_seq27:960-1304(+)